jgi:hypothetical protein
LVGFDRYYQQPASPSIHLLAESGWQRWAGKLVKQLFPGPFMLATVTGALLTAVVLCQSADPNCRWLSHYLLS